jgi:hypothetical protein
LHILPVPLRRDHFNIENVSYHLWSKESPKYIRSHNLLVWTHTKPTEWCELTPDEPNGASSHFGIKNQKSAKSENKIYMGSRRFRTTEFGNNRLFLSEMSRGVSSLGG